MVEEKDLPFNPNLTYLGVTLNRILTYQYHLKTFCKKLVSRIAFIRQLAGTSWGGRATTVRTSTLALVHSTAEYWELV